MVIELKESIQEPKQTQQNTQMETVESFLKNKISNPDTQAKLIPIFNDIKKDIPEQDILEFLNAKNIRLLLRGSNTLDPKDVKGFRTGEIMDYLQANGKTISIIQEKIGDKSTTIEDKSQKKETFELINNSRKEAKDAYDKLDSRYKANDEELAKYKLSLPPGTITNIENKLAGTNISTDEYLRLSYTAQKYKKELQGTDFFEKFKKLKEAAVLPETMGDIKSLDSNQTILDQNNSVKDYVNNADSPAFKPLKEFNYFKDMEHSDILLKFADKDLQNKIKEQETAIANTELFDDNMKPKPDRQIPDEVKKQFDAYISLKQETLSRLSEQFNNQSQNILRQRVFASTIQGLAGYFEGSSINYQNFADQCDINTQDSFTVKDDKLHIQGHIDDKNIGFIYNLVDQKAQLQCDDTLHFDNINKTFSLDPQKPSGSTDMGISMPTLPFLSDKAQVFANNNMQKILGRSTDITDFQKNFKQAMSEHLLQYYGKEYIAQNRIEKQVYKNMASQGFVSSYIPDKIRLKTIDQNSDPNAWNLLRIYDSTLENSNTQDIKSLSSLTKRLDDALDNNLDDKDNLLEGKRKDMFTNIKKERKSESVDQDRGHSTLKFFAMVSDKDHIDLQNLNVLVNLLEKGESIGKNIGGFSPEFQTTLEQEGAEELLREIK